MSLFNKVFTDPASADADESVLTDPTSSTIESATQTLPAPDQEAGESPFASFVKDTVRFGATSPSVEQSVALVDHDTHNDAEVEEEAHHDEEVDETDVESFDNGDDTDTLEFPRYDEDADEDIESEAVAQPEPTLAPVVEQTVVAAPLPAPTNEAVEPVIKRASQAQVVEQSTPPPPQPVPSTIQPRVATKKRTSKLEQLEPRQVQQIADTLFDRMRGVWDVGARRAEALSEELKRTEQRLQLEQHSLTEGKAEITKLLRDQIPRVVKDEMLGSIKKEITTAIRAGLSRALKDEFENIERVMTRQLERLHAIESRMAKIEGVVDREIQINFPKGAVQIDAPITIPEREVRFGEGAISVNFNKTGGGKKEVHFERDPHDQSIKSAEIVDVSEK